MKKILAVLAFVFVANTVFAYQNFFGVSAGLMSGIPFYGSSEINDLNREVSDQSRIIIGGLAYIHFNVSDNATFFFGSDLLCDFIWQGTSEHSNHLNYDFSIGIKIFPNLAGFCTGLGYVLGARTDFIETEEGSYSGTSAWGNGIKLLAEYNFAHDGKSRYYPTLGLFWKILPRGNHEFDNMICAYIMANL